MHKVRNVAGSWTINFLKRL